MKTLKKYFCTIVLLLGLVSCGDDGNGSSEGGGGEIIPSTLKAFPNAEGGGAYVTGGRGKPVVYVENLNDDGPGSFRWAVSGHSRMVLFNVSGTIALNSPVDIAGNITIAGQSAPGKGITIKNFPVRVKGDNVIIRFMRFRLGYDTRAVDAYDAFEGQNRQSIMIDHCSMSWSVDECASFYDNNNFTMQYCIIAESLKKSGHPKGNHGYGGLWGGRNATFHHNLLAHHDSRNPRFCGDRFTGKLDNEKVDFCNNVVYGWGGNSGYAGEGGYYNIVNNYYKPASYSSVRTRIFAPDSDPSNGGSSSKLSNKLGGVNKPWWGHFYVSGNYMDGKGNNWDWNGIEPKVDGKRDGTLTAEQAKENIKEDSAVDFSNKVNIQPAAEAYDIVLAYAGASLVRDAVDIRVVDNVKNGTGAIINKPSDVGGYPDLGTETRSADFDVDKDGMPDDWEGAKDLKPNDKDLDPDYTNLEVYLNSLVTDCFPQ